MELQKKYWINIISQISVNDGNCSFVVMERLNRDSSQHFQNYRKSLLKFNVCGDWFQKLDYPHVQIGTIVLVQINKNTNIWARGIISKLDTKRWIPEIYLIDSQKFVEYDTKLELRVCPPKFSQLILPTYIIDVNFGLNDDDSKSVIQMLINKNQHGDLSFHFIPKSIQNNIYSGELIINNMIDSTVISIKKILKKYFTDISNFKPQHTFSVFDPLQLKYLQTIFIPRDPNSIVFVDSDSYYPDINYSHKNISYESQDESSVLDFSEDFSFSDDSSLDMKKRQNDFMVPITKQKVYSSFSSSISTSNSSLPSNCSLEKKHSSHLNPVQNILKESFDQKTIVSTSSESITSDIQNSISQIKQCSIGDQNIEISISKEKHLVNMPVKKCFNSVSKLFKYNNAESQQNTNLNMVPKALETPKMNANLLKDANKFTDDSNIWWSSDDES